MTQPSFNTYGAVDLGALRDRRDAAERAAARTSAPTPDGAGALPEVVIDATEATFQDDVLLRSQQVPVVIDFWASWCGPCRTLSPVLEKLAREDAGAWVLAKVDADANPGLVSAFQVQGIPAVFAVIGGQLAPLFTGALPEAQVRQYLDQVLAIAEQQGLPGPGAAAGEGGEADALAADEGAVPSAGPAYAAAEDALDAGDFEGAVREYQALLDRSPADGVAAAGLAQAELMQRADELDLAAALAAAQAAPDDVEAQLRGADAELLSGRVDDAFDRLVAAVGRSVGAEREVVRARLLQLFVAVGPDDPRVARARRRLSAALF